jgi:hypothetical protein
MMAITTNNSTSVKPRRLITRPSPKNEMKDELVTARLCVC